MLYTVKIKRVTGLSTPALESEIRGLSEDRAHALLYSLGSDPLVETAEAVPDPVRTAVATLSTGVSG